MQTKQERRAHITTYINYILLYIASLFVCTVIIMAYVLSLISLQHCLWPLIAYHASIIFITAWQYIQNVNSVPILTIIEHTSIAAALICNATMKHHSAVPHCIFALLWCTSQLVMIAFSKNCLFYHTVSY